MMKRVLRNQVAPTTSWPSTFCLAFEEQYGKVHSSNFPICMHRNSTTGMWDVFMCVEVCANNYIHIYTKWKFDNSLYIYGGSTFAKIGSVDDFKNSESFVIWLIVTFNTALSIIIFFFFAPPFFKSGRFSGVHTLSLSLSLVLISNLVL